jgi:hypothetical protein
MATPPVRLSVADSAANRRQGASRLVDQLPGEADKRGYLSASRDKATLCPLADFFNKIGYKKTCGSLF